MVKWVVGTAYTDKLQPEPSMALIPCEDKKILAFIQLEYIYGEIFICERRDQKRKLTKNNIIIKEKKNNKE